MSEVFIATETDGSKWVRLEDYQLLMQKYLISELALDEQAKLLSNKVQCSNCGAREDSSKGYFPYEDSDEYVCSSCANRNKEPDKCQE